MKTCEHGGWGDPSPGRLDLKAALAGVVVVPVNPHETLVAGRRGLPTPHGPFFISGLLTNNWAVPTVTGDMRHKGLKKALLVFLALVACAPTPVGDMSSYDSTEGDQVVLYESSGSTGGGSTGSDDQGFIDRPDVGHPVDEGKWGWNQKDCFTYDDEFISCQYFCEHNSLGDCLAIETFQDECGEHLTGTKVVGWCNLNPFDEWPDSENLQVRCMCHM